MLLGVTSTSSPDDFHIRLNGHADETKQLASRVIPGSQRQACSMGAEVELKHAQTEQVSAVVHHIEIAVAGD
jgi:hypothetical protein